MPTFHHLNLDQAHASILTKPGRIELQRTKYTQQMRRRPHRAREIRCNCYQSSMQSQGWLLPLLRQRTPYSSAKPRFYDSPSSHRCCSGNLQVGRGTPTNRPAGNLAGSLAQFSRFSAAVPSGGNPCEEQRPTNQPARCHARRSCLFPRTIRQADWQEHFPRVLNHDLSDL